ncbi:MAG: hypothetical protein HYY24_01165 [Verrucomicrobia bacterium]|nr:hypothetical protein [Verrucomicrobiota bacterium]
MKTKSVFILSALALAGLVGLLWVQHRRAASNEQGSTRQIEQLSNSLVQAAASLAEQETANRLLRTDLSTQTEDLTRVTSELAAVRESLAKVQEEALAAETRAQEESARQEKKIENLEAEKDDLTQRMMELNSSIMELEAKIGETERKLSTAEGERGFLLKELARLEAEKADLERQFNDLVVLRAQIRKLKDEVAVVRRQEWMRRGLHGPELKGAELLQRGFWVPVAKTDYDLNVELPRRGEVKVNQSAPEEPSPRP